MRSEFIAVLHFSEMAYFGADGSGDNEKDALKSEYPIGDMPNLSLPVPKHPQNSFPSGRRLPVANSRSQLNAQH
ncbi:hypothetical protein CCP4SC76_4650002 [Gammaproteobacteria bacterium]